MKYPDGSQVRIGDLIWWNEGNCLGYVQAIAESKEDYDLWGLDAPQILICNRHPFDPSLATTHNNVGTPALIFYPSSCMGDDGIGPLNVTERQEFTRASQSALHNRGYRFFSVTTHVENGEFKAWIFTIMDEQGRENVVTIPYEKQRFG